MVGYHARICGDGDGGGEITKTFPLLGDVLDLVRFGSVR